MKTLLEVFAEEAANRGGSEPARKGRSPVAAKLLSTSEAAARLGCTARRVVALIREGRLPAVRVGRSWVIREADLMKYTPLPQGYPKGRKRG